MKDWNKLPVVLLVKELAEFLRIGRGAAYALVHAGGFPAVRVGRTFRVPRDPLRQWLENRCTANGRPATE